MRSRLTTPPTLCIALHDVAPSTWPACERLLSMIDALGAPPVTLLVVPEFHHRGRIDADAGFVRALGQRIERGDEVALHGYFHVDAAPPPRTPRAWLRRRLLTAGEGEFAALDEHEAYLRIARGLDLFDRLGWHADGFVAPAWLLGAGARRALARTRLHYTSTHTHLHILDESRLDEGSFDDGNFGNSRCIAAPCLTASSRSAWRRATSRVWLRAAGAALARHPRLRVALHPGDAEHAALRAAWQRLLTGLLATREPLTKAALVARVNATASRLDAVTA